MDGICDEMNEYHLHKEKTVKARISSSVTFPERFLLQGLARFQREKSPSMKSIESLKARGVQVCYLDPFQLLVGCKVQLLCGVPPEECG